MALNYYSPYIESHIHSLNYYGSGYIGGDYLGEADPAEIEYDETGEPIIDTVAIRKCHYCVQREPNRLIYTLLETGIWGWVCEGDCIPAHPFEFDHWYTCPKCGAMTNGKEFHMCQYDYKKYNEHNKWYKDNYNYDFNSYKPGMSTHSHYTNTSNIITSKKIKQQYLNYLEGRH